MWSISLALHVIEVSDMAEEKNNIIQQLMDLTDEICNNYCKYPLIYKPEEHDGVDLCESEICAECPLTKYL